jgi:hypothetical protein
MLHPIPPAQGGAIGASPIQGLTVAPAGYAVPFARVGEEASPDAPPPATVTVPVYQLQSAVLIEAAGGLPPGAEPPVSEGFLCPTEALMEREVFVCSVLKSPALSALQPIRLLNPSVEHLQSVFMTLRGACLCDHCVLTRHAWRDLKAGASNALLDPSMAISVRDRAVASPAKLDPGESALAVALNTFLEHMYEVRQHVMLTIIRNLYEIALPVLPPSMQPASLLPTLAQTDGPASPAAEAATVATRTEAPTSSGPSADEVSAAPSAAAESPPPQQA